MIGGIGLSAMIIGAYVFFNERLKQGKNKQVKISIPKNTINQAASIHTEVTTRQVPNWNNAFDMN